MRASVISFLVLDEVPPFNQAQGSSQRSREFAECLGDKPEKLPS